MPYYEFVDGTSSKFWEIHDYWNSDKPYVEVRFGKIGTTGRTTQHPYYKFKGGKDIMEKLMTQKLKKGYKMKKTPKKFIEAVRTVVTLQNTTKKMSPSAKKDCPPGKVRNPKSGRCINDPALKKTATKKKSPKAKETKSNKSKSPCPPGKVRNPKSGRCINEKKTATKKKSPKAKATKKKSPKVKSLSNSPKVTLPTTGMCKSGADGSRVYDVGKKGVMLAHVYKDANGKVKNPPKGFPMAPNGWFLSEKYDGYRAVWDGKDFRSRNNNIFEAPKWFKDWLPAGISLDGELFIGRGKFEECGIFRRKVPDDAEWRKFQVKYQIFDSPTAPGVFEDRQKFITNLIKKKCDCVKTGDKCPLILTKQTKVKDEAQVMKIYEDLVKKGAEGVMLRAPGSPYEAKRTAHLLKVKPSFDDECKIIGYKAGTGKYVGKLGAFKCELAKDSKIKFDISGMNDAIRSSYKTTHPIGTIVTFEHKGINKSGVPRHPNYVRIRHRE